MDASRRDAKIVRKKRIEMGANLSARQNSVEVTSSEQ